MEDEMVEVIRPGQVIEVGQGYLKTDQWTFDFTFCERNASGEPPYFSFGDDKNNVKVVVVFDKCWPRFLRRWVDPNYTAFHKFQRSLELHGNKSRDLS